MTNEQQGFLANLKYDLPASLIVFLVAVPLCLGIALASGAPALSGIIAGVIGGIVVGVLSGSQLGVSGPAAGLAIIVLKAIADLGAFDTFLVAVVISGVLQLILGLVKAGIIGYFFPSSVIKGMLSGIGITIFIKQFPYALGAKKLKHSFLGFDPNTITIGAVVLTLISLGVLVLWEQKFMKKIKAFQIVQGPLVVVALGIAYYLLFKGQSLNINQTVDLPITKNMDDFKKLFTFPNFAEIANPKVWKFGFTIAIVASLETLLSLDATDKLDPQKRVSPPNQELIAQGVGNVISGLIGGLPVTQVIVRSSTNIQSGGKTKISAIIHGFILMISVLVIPSVLNFIPLASLAAVLFLVGYKLAKPELFQKMYKLGMSHFIPFVATILGIVFLDLLKGIGIGLAIAIFYILYNNFKKPFLFESKEHLKDGELYLVMAEDITFLNKASIQSTLSQIPDGTKVTIDASKSINIDQDVKEIIEEFSVNAAFRNITLTLIEFDSVNIGNQAKKFETALKAQIKV